MEDALVPAEARLTAGEELGVLILVVMEDALVLELINQTYKSSKCLNPCCNGRCTRTLDSASSSNMRNAS